MARTAGTKTNVKLELQKKEVLKLRGEGFSFREIERMTGLSRTIAHKYCTEAISKLNEVSTEAMEIWREREWKITDDLLMRYLPLADDGDYKAAELVLKTLERRAKYRGLDAPVRNDNLNLNMDINPTLTKQQMHAEIMKRLENLQKKKDGSAVEELNWNGNGNGNGTH